jgi:hypothetical protein
MTQNVTTGQTHDLRRPSSSTRSGSKLSLQEMAPADWHHDRPAFAGDPFMDWESQPEPSKEERWSLANAGHKQA